jgi:hypothetical protein
LKADPKSLKDIVARATIVDGRVFPISNASTTGLVMSPQNQQRIALLDQHAHREGESHSDACAVNYWLQAAVSQAYR